MTTKSKFLLLAAILALVVTIAYVDHRRSTTVAKLIELGDVSSLEIQFRGKPAVLKKQDRRWVLERFADTPARDVRVNQDMINHLVDLVRALSTNGTELDPRDAAAYGTQNPELKIMLSWVTPKAGHETVSFGHRDLSEKRVFAFFPERPLLTEVPVYAVELLSNKEPLDIRDRRITTFDPDDVEDLIANGKCGQFKLSRDGDRWLRSGAPIKNQNAEQWLNRLLTTHYDAIQEEPAASSSADRNPVCEIELRGRRGRVEQLQIFKTSGTLWASNSQLPALYHLPPGIMQTLVPPR